MSALMKIIYGIEVEDENDFYVQISEAGVAGVVEGLVPGKFLVEFLPFLRYIPPWFPGATSQRLWAKWKAAANRLKNVPFEHSKAILVRLSSITVKCPSRGCILTDFSSLYRRTGKPPIRLSPSCSIACHNGEPSLRTMRKSLKTWVRSHSEV